MSNTFFQGGEEFWRGISSPAPPSYGPGCRLKDSLHIRFRWSYSAKHVLYLKPHWNVKVVWCTKFVTLQVTLGSIVGLYILCIGFQGHFCKITLAPFHLSLKISKSHGNTGFRYFSKYIKSTKKSPWVIFLSMVERGIAIWFNKLDRSKVLQNFLNQEKLKKTTGYSKGLYAKHKFWTCNLASL